MRNNTNKYNVKFYILIKIQNIMYLHLMAICRTHNYVSWKTNTNNIFKSLDIQVKTEPNLNLHKP